MRLSPMPTTAAARREAACGVYAGLCSSTMGREPLGKYRPAPSVAMTSGQLCGDLMRRRRLACGLTKAERAERTNLSIRGLSGLERGGNNVHLC